MVTSVRSIIFISLISLTACGGGGGGDGGDSTPPPTPPPSNQMPTVSITNFSSGEIVTGTVEINFTAEDNDGTISSVSCVEENSSTELPVTENDTYTCEFATSTFADGYNGVTVSATDNDGATASTELALTIDNVMPQASIVEPSNSEALSGEVTFMASASDFDSNIFQFVVDGVVVISTTSGSLEYVWDTTQVEDGSYIIAAEAIDLAVNLSSDAVTYEVRNNPSTIVDRDKDGIADDVDPIVFALGRNWLSKMAVYPEELQGGEIVLSAELVLPEGWSAYSWYRSDTFLENFIQDAVVESPFEDIDGDGVYESVVTLDFPEAHPPKLRDGTTDRFFIEIRFRDENADKIPRPFNNPGGGLPQAMVGVVSKTVNATIRSTSSPNVHNTENGIIAVRLDDFDSSREDFHRVSRLAYSVYNDDRWDGILFANLGRSYTLNPVGGEPDAPLYGSSGKLISIGWMDNSFDFEAALHEFWHHRLFYFNDPSLRMGIWENGVIEGPHAGFCDFEGSFALGDIIDNGDGTSTLESQQLPVPMYGLSEVSAYWVGMLPSFSPFRCYTNASVPVRQFDVVPNTSITEIDVNTLTSVYGASPTPFETSKKDYTEAILLVTQGRHILQSEADYFTAIARHLAGIGEPYLVPEHFENLQRISPGSFHFFTHGNGSLSFPTDEP